MDYFKLGGKTKEVFLSVVNELKVAPHEILHIGDNIEMDIENAKKANVNAIFFDGDVGKLINEINKNLKE